MYVYIHIGYTYIEIYRYIVYVFRSATAMLTAAVSVVEQCENSARYVLDHFCESDVKRCLIVCAYIHLYIYTYIYIYICIYI